MPFDSTPEMVLVQNPVKFILIGALEKIEGGWCQTTAARDFRGNQTDARASNAVSFCVSGAIEASGRDYQRPEILASLNLFAHAAKIDKIIPIPVWNDNPGRTKDEVIAAFKKAIEMA